MTGSPIYGPTRSLLVPQMGYRLESLLGERRLICDEERGNHYDGSTPS